MELKDDSGDQPIHLAAHNGLSEYVYALLTYACMYVWSLLGLLIFWCKQILSVCIGKTALLKPPYIKRAGGIVIFRL